MRLEPLGGLASRTCAVTDLFGFAFLVTFLARIGYGIADINARAVVDFIKTAGAVFGLGAIQSSVAMGLTRGVSGTKTAQPGRGA